MPTELEQQLADYATWLERSHGLDMRPPGRRLAPVDGPATSELARVAFRRTTPRSQRADRTTTRRRFIAGGLVAAAAAGLFVVVNREGRTDPSIGDDSVVADTSAAGSETLLYRARPGDAIDEIGRDACGDCDGPPWAPVLLDDGTVVVADWFNYRWITVIDGDPTVAPFGDWFVSTQPITDGYDVWALTRALDDTDYMGEAMLRQFSADDMSTPLSSTGTPYPMVVQYLEAVDGGIAVGGDPIPGVSAPSPPRIDAQFNVSDSSTVTVTSDGVARRWDFADGWTVVLVDDFTPNELPSGTLILDVESPEGDLHLVELRPDGTSAAIDVSGYDGPFTAGPQGIVTMTFRNGAYDVVLLPLPVVNPDAVPSPASSEILDG